MNEVKHNDFSEVRNNSLELKKADQRLDVRQSSEGFGVKHSDYSPDERIRPAEKTDSVEVKDKDEGLTYVHTYNESLKNTCHPITGVFFKERTIKLPSGERLKGVFPEFESKYDAKIDKSLYLEKDVVQFKECNKQLLAKIEADPKFRDKFTETQIEQIRDGVQDGTAPDGYVWHHDAEPGKMQLVDAVVHAHTGHYGGRFVWGGGSSFR